MFLQCITWSSPAEAIAAESHNSVKKHVVTNWDGLDAKAFAGIYKSNCASQRWKRFSRFLKKYIILTFCKEAHSFWDETCSMFIHARRTRRQRCYILHNTCCMVHVRRYMLQAACYVLHVLCNMLRTCSVFTLKIDETLKNNSINILLQYPKFYFENSWDCKYIRVQYM